MIKLHRSPRPGYLSDNKITELTDAFILEPNKSVWNHPEIKKSLLKSTNGKCAFCESNVSEESKYMEVEHFRYKKKYMHLVVEWNNLLPSCKRCNVAKKDHDIEQEPLLNPYDDNPRQHLGFRLYMLRGLTSIGCSTIECLDLNNVDRLVHPRFEIGMQVQSSISIANERMERWINESSTKTRNRLIAIMETILNECQSKAIYAATTATIVLTDEKFTGIVSTMQQNDIWPEHMDALLQKAKQLTLTMV